MNRVDYMIECAIGGLETLAGDIGPRIWKLEFAIKRLWAKKHCEVMLCRTKKGKFELLPVEYETVGRISLPTKRADRIMAKYHTCKTLQYALDNPYFQSKFQKIFGKFF